MNSVCSLGMFDFLSVLRGQSFITLGTGVG